jgi:hypothetical protein
MKVLTPEEIVAQAEAGSKDSKAIRASINKLYRLQDESHLWPISGEFNVTDRAIKRVWAFEAQSDKLCPLGYALAVDAEISRIVNDQKNWSCNRVEFYEQRSL